MSPTQKLFELCQERNKLENKLNGIAGALTDTYRNIKNRVVCQVAKNIANNVYSNDLRHIHDQVSALRVSINAIDKTIHETLSLIMNHQLLVTDTCVPGCLKEVEYIDAVPRDIFSEIKYDKFSMPLTNTNINPGLKIKKNKL